jgi:DNA-3-methyladenine glycosylase II
MPARTPVPPPQDDPLTEERLAAAVDHLAARDPVLAAAVERHGRPPLWAREPGFPTLIHIVLEQQVSLVSARAAFDRLRAARSPLSPAAFLELDDRQLFEIGFSRQKTRYGRELARAVLDGQLDLDSLASLDDDAVDARLTAVPGIGPWTATIYRLMVLGRPDAWPVHDIALAQAVADLRGLDHRPTAEEMARLADHWRPWRAVAARILWHHYLSERAIRRRATGRAEPQRRVADPG